MLLILVFSVFPQFTETSSRINTQKDYEASSSINKQVCELNSSSVESKVQKTFEASSISNLNLLDSQAFEHMGSSMNADVDVESSHLYSGDGILTGTSKGCNSPASRKSDQVTCSLHLFLSCVLL